MEPTSSPSTDLCHACSKSALLSTPWSQLSHQIGPVVGTRRVMYAWDTAESSVRCAFCKFIREQIGYVERDVETIR